jgi:CheY-like chemotaxis protein
MSKEDQLGLKNNSKILIIDDSDASLEIMELYVESEFENPIITATSGLQAIELLKKTDNISIILCDYNMPKGDGGDVFQYVKKKHPDIPFILVCGEDPHMLKDLPKLDGLLVDKKVLPVIPKPFRKDGLIQAVKYISKHSYNHSDQLMKKIHLNRFYQYNDLFEKHRIKIIGHGEGYQAQNIYLKYKEKNLQYIYFEKNQYERFLEFVSQEINDELNSPHLDLDEDIILQLDAIQIVHESVRHNIKIDVLKDFPQKIFQSILGIYKKGVSFKKILDHIIIHPHLPSQLSILSSYLSCHLLNQTNVENLEKKINSFILASIFMDISLEDNELVNINSFENKAYINLTRSYQNLVKEHPQKSCEYMNTFYNHDPLTEKLILYHHGPSFSADFENIVEQDQDGTDICFFSISHQIAQEIIIKNLKVEQIQEVVDHIRSSYPKNHILGKIKDIA